ncbi:MAG: type II toxin-antitoxin system RelE/ParE family toxin [Rhodospirillales bacterium]|nr:type II toxin-antitoxin system RelE/ParE family toxin [Rhodospirillales bacterium]
MKLEIAKSAFKTLDGLQPKLRAAMYAELLRLAAAPYGNHPNAKRLKGADDMFRLRHGDWRILYSLDRETDTLRVAAIETRGGVYK